MWYMKSICIRIRFRMKIKLSKHTTQSTLLVFGIILGTSIAAMGTIHEKPYQQSLVFARLRSGSLFFCCSFLFELRCERMQWNCFRWIYDIKYERIDWILHAYVHHGVTYWSWAHVFMYSCIFSIYHSLSLNPINVCVCNNSTRSIATVAQTWH